MSVVCSNTVGGWVGGHPECLYWWVLEHPTLAIGFWIVDCGFWILEFGFWILDFGFWTLHSGFWTLTFYLTIGRLIGSLGLLPAAQDGVVGGGDQQINTP